MRELAREVLEWCDHLASYSEEADKLTRTFLSPPMKQVHSSLSTWMEELGMQTWLDSAGNVHGLYGNTSQKRLMIASHLDTVPNAGKYDGILGVVLGIALVEALEGKSLPYAIEVVGFSEEEGVRFSVPFIGSRALVGTAQELLSRTDRQGVTVAQALSNYGLDPSGLSAAYINGEHYLGYLELHIEQGPVLEAHNLALGVVSSIAGQSRLDVKFTGLASHAGTTPMSLRKDAVSAAAEFILATEHIAQNTEGLVATVGQIQALPGAGNVIAGEVLLSLDIRHASDEVRELSLRNLLDTAHDIAAKRNTPCEHRLRSENSAVPMDEHLQELLLSALSTPPFSLVSGAGHDAMIMAQELPCAMLFLRSPRGLSHHPEEAVLLSDVTEALHTGVRFLELLGETHV